MGIFDREKSDYPRIERDDPLAADNPHLVKGRWGKASNDRWGSRPAEDSTGKPSRWGSRASTAGRFGSKAAGGAAKTGRFLWDSGPEWK